MQYPSPMTQKTKMLYPKKIFTGIRFQFSINIIEPAILKLKETFDE